MLPIFQYIEENIIGGDTRFVGPYGEKKGIFKLYTNIYFGNIKQIIFTTICYNPFASLAALRVQVRCRTVSEGFLRKTNLATSYHRLDKIFSSMPLQLCMLSYFILFYFIFFFGGGFNFKDLYTGPFTIWNGIHSSGTFIHIPVAL